MQIEKHLVKLREVLDEIEAALKDKKGVISHQARLGSMISLGVVTLIELYFHKLSVIKEGSNIKHQWLKITDAKEILSKQITSPIDSIDMIDEILRIADKIEQKRNDITYGSPLNEESILLEQIKLFFEAKKIIENKTGELL
ncbi:MAG: hypothetical protein V1870_01875 [Candidatus Aenigmatarchaeota archaeon]